MRNLLIYIDPGFLSEGGHYKTFATNIKNSSKNSNWDYIHYVSKDVLQEDIRMYNLKKLFTYRAFLPNNLSSAEIENRAKDFERKLKHIFKSLLIKRRFYKKVVIYMYTSDLLYIQKFSKICKKYKFKNVFIHVVLFYLDNNFCRGLDSPIYESLLKKTNSNVKDCENLHIHMDSNLAIERYQRHFDKKITTFPFPLFSTKEIKQDSHKEISFNNKEKIKIGYFGYVTTKHGFNYVFELIKRLDNTKYEFVLKINDNMQRDTELLWQMEVLKVLSNVKVITGYVQNYLKLLKSCDLILIPYSIQDYPVQTSGILIDAILNNKQIITTERTWLGNTVKDINIGVTFRNIEDLEEQIKKYKIRKIDYKQRDKFLRTFTVENFFDAIAKY